MNQEASCLSEELAQLDLTEQDLECDPTLASCCLQDIKDQKRAEQLRALLLKQDPTNQRTEMLNKVLYPPGEGPDDDELSDFGEEDGQLQDIRMKRIQQLQKEAEDKKQRQQRGFGRLNEVKEEDLLEVLEDMEGPCVCHLAISGFQVSEECNQQLESLAHQYQGCMFITCSVSRKSHLRESLRMTSLHGLVCLRDGSIIGRIPLDIFGAAHGDILEEELTAYLKRLGMLRQAPVNNQRPAPSRQQQYKGTQHAQDSEDDAAGSDNDDKPDDDEQEGAQGGRSSPCEICGRSYPHQHVKAVYRAEQSDSEADSEDL